MLLSRVPLITAMAALILIRTIQAADFAAPSLLNHAESMSRDGRFAEADPQYQPTLAIEEETFGLNRPETIPVLKALADFYHSLGRDRESGPLCRRVLDVRERTLDPLDPAIASNPALVLPKTGRESHGERASARTTVLRQGRPRQ